MSPYSKPVALPSLPADPAADQAADRVTALYRANAVGLVRLAHVLIGDPGVAEDIVQDAFYGLYRRWEHLNDQEKALPYVRSAVLNSCRTLLRRRRPEVTTALVPDARQPLSAEAMVLSEEQRRAVMAAVRRLPARQREALVLRFYLDLSEAQIAAQMGIGPSTVRSATHRALTALGRMLKETP
jgi:RNA polymerase sigma-70 factor (sigma-E family)